MQNVFIHCFMDGRDTPPNSGRDYLQRLQHKLRELGIGQIATINGRYYAMDRDNRWEREELAYRAMVHGRSGNAHRRSRAAMQRSYEQGVTDEFVEPVVISKGTGADAPPVGLIRDDDACIFFNYRADRAREMTMALVAPDFDKFADAKRPKNLFYVTMTQYDKIFGRAVRPRRENNSNNILAQRLCRRAAGKISACAETEKYAHVTYFFNGGIEKPFAGEEREMVPSPKVATYDLKPEMSAEASPTPW